MVKARQKVRVIINMAMSADGKISTARREKTALGSKEDRRLMDVLRSRADAVIIGSGTLRVDGWAVRVRDPDIRHRRTRSQHTPHPINVVLSTTLDISPRREFFTYPQTEKIIITTRSAPAARIRRFEKFGDVVVLPARRIRPERVLDRLASYGIGEVVLEGGGKLNYSFIEDDCVDQIYVTLTPRILGGESAPTMVDGKGFPWIRHVRLDLVSCRRREDEVFLRYRVRR